MMNEKKLDRFGASTSQVGRFEIEGLTNLPGTPKSVVKFYNKRGTALPKDIKHWSLFAFL
jgi:hypothetical protein